MLVAFSLLNLTCRILYIGEDIENVDAKPLSNFKQSILSMSTKIAGFIYFHVTGFHIKEEHVKITDFDPTYKGTQPKDFTRAPLIVSNHVSKNLIQFFFF